MYDKVLLSNVAECDTVNVTVCDVSLLLYAIQFRVVMLPFIIQFSFVRVAICDYDAVLCYLLIYVITVLCC